jgi:hypothetical protein
MVIAYFNQHKALRMRSGVDAYQFFFHHQPDSDIS